ncbi:MAG: peptide chain release factor N(5)-glutamine methyltransferase [Burkholderiales bacterium]|nr:peptide chain release factor N(5)-glutamine methyltransferase [Burkholderiales bacterium]
MQPALATDAALSVERLIVASGLPALEARVLAAHALGVERAWLSAHGQERLDDSMRLRVEAIFRRRREGEPLAYLTGAREFYGLDFGVTPAVLIPRPETELLVQLALERLRGGERVIELGTGSGAVAIALALERPDLEVTATDCSAAALQVARANAQRHGARVRFESGRWFAAVPGESFDMVVSNPPYIAAGDAHLAQGDLRFEPWLALQAGPDGLACLREIASAAPAHLRPGGWLLLEHGFEQGPACVALARSLDYLAIEDFRDLAGNPRTLVAQAPGAPRRFDLGAVSR